MAVSQLKVFLRMALILCTTVAAAVIILPHQITPHLTLKLTGMAEDSKYQKMLSQIIKHFIIF